jgi:phage-related protein
LVAAILLLAGALDYAGEAIKAFAQFAGKWIQWGANKVADGMIWLWRHISSIWNRITDTIGDKLGLIGSYISAAVRYIRSLPNRILEAVRNFDSLLENAGRNLIKGLMRGIRDSIPGLSSLLNWVTAHLPSWKGPEDKDKLILQPAGKAVMSGFITGINSGAAELRDALTGITQQIGTGTTTTNQHSVNFGPGSIHVSFMGDPTREQAYETGQAVGAGINSQLDIRNVSLGVRRM